MLQMGISLNKIVESVPTIDYIRHAFIIERSEQYSKQHAKCQRYYNDASLQGYTTRCRDKRIKQHMK